MNKKPILLCILDGWGEMNNGDSDAIALAKTPNFDRFLQQYPKSTLETYGLSVGLPKGQMGNSEVGHMNIGSGRVVLQSLPKIDAEIEEKKIDKNPAIEKSIQALKDSKGALHLMGLCSDGGVHAHMDHIIYLAKLYADKTIKVYIHAFTDGRDTAPQSGKNFIKEIQKSIANHSNIEIATISGRYFAMDRDKRWERVEKAYSAITLGEGEKFSDAHQAILDAHENGENDEFITPMAKDGYSGISDGDGILMANFRADRAREILHTLVDPDFEEFNTKNLNLSAKIGMVDYSKNLSEFIDTIYPAEILKNTLGEIVSKEGMKQLRIAETEKYAHVTFFFNGGQEDIFKGEDRVLIPSPKVATYDLKPEMSAYELTDRLVEEINSCKYDLIVVNYANPDMVGHTGKLDAAIKAVETIDNCIEKLEQAILNQGGKMLITADHGNVEIMVDEKGRPHTQHTVGLVPLILIGKDTKNHKLNSGSLCDIAPTILDLMGLKKVQEMNGKTLID